VSTLGLVGVYRVEPLAFDADEVRLATEILARMSKRAG
jgi:hypothetical protein